MNEPVLPPVQTSRSGERPSAPGRVPGMLGVLAPAAPYLVLALLCVASLASRPLLPPDETRYLTVAWEMFLSRDWFVPTLNFAPYHHKPPLLFWLVDLSWAVLGVGRVQAMLVVFAISALVLHLVKRTGQALWPGRQDIADRLPWLMLGSVPFVIYSSLILFDLLLTACILAAFLSILSFARGRGTWRAVLAGLAIGLGVLAKGPVVLLHVAWPIALYPLWRTERETLSIPAFSRGMALALLAAMLPVTMWLVPALLGTDGQFAHDLIWEQSAGRISGNMEASHPRPLYFYLLLLPVLGLPWIASPDLWRRRPGMRLASLFRSGSDGRYMRLLVLWGSGVFVIFSLISGKQPHYLVPLLPLVTLAFGWLMAEAPLRRVGIAAIACVVVLGLAQAAGNRPFLSQFDLGPVSKLIGTRPGAPVGFVGRYQGQLGFLARLTVPVEPVAPAGVEAWLDSHPGGFLVVADDRKVSASRPAALAVPYRGRRLSVYGPPPVAP